jgi:hypothetical protein
MNKLRQYKVTAQGAASVVGNPIEKDFDQRGNPRYGGFIAGRRFRVVVALDDPDVIITLFPKERG